MSPTPIQNEPTRYTTTAKVLHWVLGLSILGLIGLGWYMSELAFSPTKLKLINWHKWGGILVLLLSVLRLAWRITHRPPALPPAIQNAMPRWQHIAHHGTHHLMYALFFIVPLMGWLYSSAAGFPVVLFGVLPLPNLVAASPELTETLKPWHGWLAWTLTALIALHVLAVIKHQLIDRDGLLSRMLPGR